MSEPNPARFYMVFNPAANPPTYMHGGKQSAIDEAKRLASKHHGQRFFVLEAVEAYQVDLPEPRRIELGGNALRFQDPSRFSHEEIIEKTLIAEERLHQMRPRPPVADKDIPF
ncbi:hypothetical protein HGO34_15680 [Agrobacterium vitis]|uniref:hypothetical protein n=1 Tax=Agrobacterium vitis TaxID=373 RepID=UPI000872A670|nr:hypothetical protein [Agrobacterium vitis]MCF1498935.1 hypothetical protein [Allorhizobium sp. Av2]MCM2441162.1 hypothetical protein [Agrobacterium vitis]MCM2453389.1 hypothetical protein [Agrobacterium vitis]MCM2470930.1 hypothetical protein [Agrobacterium vitis]MUO70078.1 hypothetical protein [Agrobacterium vitis]